MANAHAVDDYICNDQRLSTGGENDGQPASGCVLLVARVSEAVKRKDGGQQGQTRQPLRSHQVCWDTLEHSEPDGICPPGVRSRPDDIQTQGQAKKEGRIEDGTSCL